MFGKGRKTDGPREEVESSKPEGKGSWFKDNQSSIIAVGMIVIMAFVMRFVFSYGISADSAFALSGGAVASEHLHTIVGILNGGSFFGSDSGLNYPFGSVNGNPVFIDMILAAIANIGQMLGMETVKASSLTLATFSLACGTLAVIPMFLLGKEVVGTKKAGYVAALFLAFCPVVISQTVFSNGTETGWILLLFLIFALFLFKGIKSINETKMEDSFKDVLKSNVSAIRYAAISGLLLALIALSTSDFRPIVVLLIVTMPVLVVLGRFLYKDTRMTSAFFSIITVIGMAVASAYYIPALLWDQVLSGVLIASAISVVLCMSFSMLQTKPWVVTVPAYVIVVIAAFALLSALAPEMYDVIVNGNSVYADALVDLTKSSLSLSMMSTNYGVVPFWLTIFVIGVMVFRLPKNLSSVKYLFTLLFMFIGVAFSIRDNELSAIFAPATAIGFAYSVMWLFDHVDFKTYFLNIKNAGFKGAWRKIIKPVPFVSILCVALLICVPCSMYAVDASISNNSTADYDGMDLGAIGYYVKTTEDYPVSQTFAEYADMQKNGALVTWVDYASDASTIGKFDVVTDSYGNGSEAVANILLANAIDGSSSAAMMIRLLKYNGFTDAIKTALTGAGLSAEDYDALVKIVENPGQYKAEVVGNVEKYGAVSTSISDENVMYIYGTEFLTTKDDGSVKYNAYTLSEMYSKVSAATCKNISYFMVNSGMFPMYYGYSSTFSTMGYVNGYTMTDSYGTIPQFITADYYTMYMTGIYSYTDAMYNSLLWRTYIGMSPAEAGFSGQTGAANYFSALMTSDGTHKAYPGYGLANYEVDDDHWYVKYNPDSKATVTSDGWVKMLCRDAQDKQEKEGGLINYLAGYPIIMKYVPNDPDKAVSGTVTSGGFGVKGIRVAVLDEDGAVRSIDYTDSEGKYKVFATGTASKIKYYAGAETLTGGSLIKTVDYEGTSTAGDVTIPPTSVNIKFMDGETARDMTGIANLQLKGRVSGNEYTPAITGVDIPVDLIPDVYDVTLKSNEGVSYLTDKSITVNVGENKGVEIALNASSVKITVKNDAGSLISSSVPAGVTVRLTNSEYPDKYYEVLTNEDSIAEFDVVNGTYICSFSGNYVCTASPIEVTESTESTVTAYEATEYTFTGFPADKTVYIYSTGYQTTSVSNGEEKVIVKLPKGTGAGASYTAYAKLGDKAYVANTDVLAAVEATVKVSGVLKDKSSNATAGTILFMKDKYQIPVTASTDGTYDVYLTASSDYMVYANTGSQVHYEKLTVGTEAIADKEIKLDEGTSVSGKTSWYSSSYQMPFVPVTVSEITGVEGSFTLITKADGSYSFYVPKDATCKLVASYIVDGAYYTGTDDDKKYTNEKAGVNGVNDFQAKVKTINVQNDSSYDIRVGGTSITKTNSKSVTLSSQSWSLIVEYDPNDGTYYYYSSSIPTFPTTGTVTVTDSMLSVTKYYVCDILGLENEDVVNVASLGDEGKRDKTTTGTARAYWLQENGEFQITVRNAASSKIFYDRVTADGTKSITVGDNLVNSIKVEGYVGLNHSGKITASYDAKNIQFDIASSGRYSVTLPANKAITLTADIEDDSDSSYTYAYAKSIVLPDNLTPRDEAYVYNMAVTSTATPKSGDVTGIMAIQTMSSNTGIATIDFTVSFTNTAGTPSLMTYAMSGGTAWNDVTFYSDSARTNQISATTFTDTSGLIYGRGTIIAANTAAGSSDLSVILKDANGKDACTATFPKDDADWSKTVPSKGTTKVNIGVNSIGDSEYKYAVELVNSDNYTKTFTITPVFPPGYDKVDNWFVTLVNGKEITEGNEVSVDGYSTATVYVKLTGKTSGHGTLPGGMEISVTAAGISEMATDSSETSVTIDGATAKAYPETSDSAVSVDSNSASGRDVVNNLSEMPAYVWALIALTIALVFLLIWLSVRRGVFSRRK